MIHPYRRGFAAAVFLRLWGMGVASCYYVEYNVGEYSV